MENGSDMDPSAHSLHRNRGGGYRPLRVLVAEMSSRGATWRGAYHPRYDQLRRSRKGQRNRRMSDKAMGGQLADMPFEKFRYYVERCKGKASHKSYGAAYQAKLRDEEKYGVEQHIYECPICGKWHLTTHPWEKE